MIIRNCLQCGKTLAPSASPNEKWCSPADFRAWYLARHPDYVPMKRKRRKLASPVTGTFTEWADDGAL
jgi:hypothetical protein